MKDKQKLRGYQEKGKGFSQLVVQQSGFWSVVKRNPMVYGLDLNCLLQLTYFSSHCSFQAHRGLHLPPSNRRLYEFKEKSSHQSLWHFFKCEQILSGGTVEEENCSVISDPSCSGVDICHFLVPMNKCKTRFWASKVQNPQLKKYLSHTVIN